MRSDVVDGARRLSSHMSALVGLLVEFDLSGEWAFDGAPSCAHWVAERADVEVCTVREWLRIGHALSVVDEIARRFGDGRLSYSKVRSLTRVADAENQYELCEIAERVPAGRLPIALAAWLNRTETDDARARRHRAATRLSWRVEPDGMVAASLRLPPEQAALFTAAIDAQVMRTVAMTRPRAWQCHAPWAGGRRWASNAPMRSLP